MVKHILYDCKRKFNSANCSSNRNGLMKTIYVSVKIIVHGKKDYSWNSSTCICEDGKYLKSVVGDSQTVCGQIIYVMDIVSKNVANAISKNVSTNSDGKKLNKKLIV